MVAATILREDGHADRRQMDAGLDGRWPGQRQMVRAAQLAFGGTVFDCALLETSRGGARVHLLRRWQVPELVTLRAGGESWTVQRRWQKDQEVGFKIVGDQAPSS